MSNLDAGPLQQKTTLEAGNSDYNLYEVIKTRQYKTGKVCLGLPSLDFY